jgi:hypothetical protein
VCWWGPMSVVFDPHCFYSENPCYFDSDSRILGSACWVSQSSESSANPFQLRFGLRNML